MNPALKVGDVARFSKLLGSRKQSQQKRTLFSSRLDYNIEWYWSFKDITDWKVNFPELNSADLYFDNKVE